MLFAEIAEDGIQIGIANLLKIVVYPNGWFLNFHNPAPGRWAFQ